MNFCRFFFPFLSPQVFFIANRLPSRNAIFRKYFLPVCVFFIHYFGFAMTHRRLNNRIIACRTNYSMLLCSWEGVDNDAIICNDLHAGVNFPFYTAVFYFVVRHVIPLYIMALQHNVVLYAFDFWKRNTNQLFFRTFQFPSGYTFRL